MIFTELPKTSTGKIRHVLREAAQGAVRRGALPERVETAVRPVWKSADFASANCEAPNRLTPVAWLMRIDVDRQLAKAQHAPAGRAFRWIWVLTCKIDIREIIAVHPREANHERLDTTRPAGGAHGAANRAHDGAVAMPVGQGTTGAAPTADRASGGGRQAKSCAGPTQQAGPGTRTG